MDRDDVFQLFYDPQHTLPIQPERVKSTPSPALKHQLVSVRFLFQSIHTLDMVRANLTTKEQAKHLL
jgi:hypothetical protein